MARWKPSFFQAKDIAVPRLISAHPEEYRRLRREATAELPIEPCEGCAYLGADALDLGADALDLADLLGHEKQGNQAFWALWSSQILGVNELLRALDGDLGLHILHAMGLGHGGLEHIHGRVRWLEGA
ncbi:hypothetical protein ACFYMW_25455 [Streptomyces sp. NPDC006692]|uniref:hypothetical protein n=1 Tax=unclassified Streptomyces TaxID=2593676 RepID=UPI003427DFF3